MSKHSKYSVQQFYLIVENTRLYRYMISTIVALVKSAGEILAETLVEEK